jgi:hypothetical protein
MTVADDSILRTTRVVVSFHPARHQEQGPPVGVGTKYTGLRPRTFPVVVT